MWDSLIIMDILGFKFTLNRFLIPYFVGESDTFALLKIPIVPTETKM